MSSAEQKVSNFYNTVGWKKVDGISEDTKRFEDLREHASDYVSKCRLRVLRHIPVTGDKMLDMASGPIPFEEYLEYSKNFSKRYCIDLSTSALAMAEERIGEHGVFLNGSFFDIPLDENFFDCSVSLHTIYHIDEHQQEEAVRKLLFVTSPGKPVIVVYSNPNAIVVSQIVRARNGIKRILQRFNKEARDDDTPSLYFYAHPNHWWQRFVDVADVSVLPWRSFNSRVQKSIFPNNRIGSWLLDLLFRLEDRYPKIFVKHFQYPMVILTKRA